MGSIRPRPHRLGRNPDHARHNEIDFRKVTQQMDSVASGTAWEDRFEAAEKLQQNFLHGSLSDQEAEEIMLLTKEATVELLTKL